MLLTLIGVFVATLSLSLGIYLFINRRQLSAAQTARERLRSVIELASEDTPSILRDNSASELAFLDRLLSGKAITARVRRELANAGSSMKVGTFMLLIPISGMATMVVGGLLSPAFDTLWLLVGLTAPILWLKRTQRIRLDQFQEQLPEAIDMLVSAMRAGYSFQAAAKFIGEEVPAPLGTEFAQFYDEQRLGIDVRTALLALQARVPSTDLKMFVTAVIIQRETGGNLGEVLTNIADVMRERAELRGKIDSLTAESRLSARMLALLPVFVFVLMALFDPGFVKPLVAVPLGRTLLGYSALSVIIGYVMMTKIARVDV